MRFFSPPEKPSLTLRSAKAESILRFDIDSRTSFTQCAHRRRLAVDRGLGGAEEVRDGHAGDLDRVLHREEEAGAGTRVDRHLEHVLAVEEDLALDDVVLRVAGDRVGEGGLAGAVRPHDRVDLALVDDEVDAAEDLAGALVGLDVDVQVLDLEHRHVGGESLSVSRPSRAGSGQTVRVTEGSMWTPPSLTSTWNTGTGS